MKKKILLYLSIALIFIIMIFPITGTLYKIEAEVDIQSEKSELIKWDKIFATSTLEGYSSRKYLPQLIADGDNSTAWVEGSVDYGINNWVQMESNTPVKIKSIEIVNGYKKSEMLFNANNRIKEILIDFSDGTSITKQLKDGFTSENKIELNKEVEAKCIKFTILDVYKGTKYNDTCVSEIKVFGEKVNENNLEKDKEPSDLVNIEEIDDTIIVDLKYASEDNFTGKKVYALNKCYLRRATAEKLAKANKKFKQDGYRIKIYDGYRPLQIQKVFWSLVPDSRYVAPPSRGSKHNRGASVDITLVDVNGNEIEMPTEFDDFSEKASPNYKWNSKKVKQNLEYLTKVMKNCGFTTISTEWWHFDDSEWEKYPIEKYPVVEPEKPDEELEMKIYNLNKKNVLNSDEVKFIIRSFSKIDWEKYTDIKRKYGYVDFKFNYLENYKNYTWVEIFDIYIAYNHSDGAPAEGFANLLLSLHKNFENESNKLYENNSDYKKCIDDLIKNFEYNLRDTGLKWSDVI